jgi:hypothetical protein
MALTAAQITQVYKVFGLPQSGSGALVFTDLAPRGTVVSTIDMNQPATALSQRLAALTAEQESEVGALLQEWAGITDYSELRVNAEGRGEGRAAGRLADDEARRENIRRTLGNVIGFYAPPGGFARVASEACGVGSAQHRLIR